MGHPKILAWLCGSSNAATAATPDGDAENSRPRSTTTASLSQIWPKKSSDRSSETSQPADGADNLSDAHRMEALAKHIVADTRKFEAYMKEAGLPLSEAEADVQGDFPSLPKEVQDVRQSIIQATSELQRLAVGPRETIRWEVWKCLDVLSLQMVNHYNIASLVPLHGTISVTDLQAKTSLDPVNLARALRHVMTNGLFKEPSPGIIAHTPSSRTLATDDALRAWVGFNSEDIFPAAANVLRALAADPAGESSTCTGFNFAFDTVRKENIFATIGRDKQRAMRMSRAMVSLTGGEGYEPHHFVRGCDLADVDRRGGTFVDVGGGHGFMCTALAKKWHGVRFVVQDLPKVVNTATTPVCDDAGVASRVRFEAHDFFTPQVVKDADVYFFRWIFHNHSTPNAVLILKQLVPALKPGARIVINDHCLRSPGSETPHDEKLIRGMDMVMLALLNAQERDEEAFRGLFAAADSRFAFKGVSRSEGCRMSVVEAVWEPDRQQR